MHACARTTQCNLPIRQDILGGCQRQQRIQRLLRHYLSVMLWLGVRRVTVYFECELEWRLPCLLRRWNQRFRDDLQYGVLE